MKEESPRAHPGAEIKRVRAAVLQGEMKGADVGQGRGILLQRMPPHEFVRVVGTAVVILHHGIPVALPHGFFPVLLHLVHGAAAAAFDLGEIGAAGQIAQFAAEALREAAVIRQSQGVGPGARVFADGRLLPGIAGLFVLIIRAGFAPKDFQTLGQERLVEKGFLHSPA